MSTQRDATTTHRPESITLGLAAWVVALVCETIQQVLNVVGSFMDSSAVRAEAIKTAQDRGVDVSSSQVDTLVAFVIIAVGVLGLVIIAVVAYMVRCIGRKTSNATSFQRVLTFFGGYLLFKALLVTFSPTTGDLPMAYYAVSGVIQIVGGVAAIVGVVLLNRKDSLLWLDGQEPGDKNSQKLGNNNNPQDQQSGSNSSTPRQSTNHPRTQGRTGGDSKGGFLSSLRKPQDKKQDTQGPKKSTDAHDGAKDTKDTSASTGHQ